MNDIQHKMLTNPDCALIREFIFNIPSFEKGKPIMGNYGGKEYAMDMWHLLPPTESQPFYMKLRFGINWI